MDHTLFPPSDHDHSRCENNLMAFAEHYCEGRGLRFTRLRQDVLRAVASSHKAIGAYQILDAFAEQGKKLAPISVYRSLDFLQEAGLIHRLESTNSFFACQRNFEDGKSCCSDEPLVFLICNECGTIGEMDGKPVAKTIRSFAEESGFAAEQSQIEISGLCRQCQAN
ncbi:MAG: transcriptional repressor [Rhodomicrobium sp.]|nr:MAG: transcriptional repressor [Rhodomicrobium sp.]